MDFGMFSGLVCGPRSSVEYDELYERERKYLRRKYSYEVMNFTSLGTRVMLRHLKSSFFFIIFCFVDAFCQSSSVPLMILDNRSLAVGCSYII